MLSVRTRRCSTARFSKCVVLLSSLQWLRILNDKFPGGSKSETGNCSGVFSNDLDTFTSGDLRIQFESRENSVVSSSPFSYSQQSYRN